MRIIEHQKNLWGRAGANVEPQRLDLWQLGLTNVVNGINSFAYEEGDLDPVPDIPAYFAMQVGLPELRVRPDVFRRDSRPYQLPAWDDPLDPVRVVFLLDAGSDVRASSIYRVLDAWRALVRAGRGSMTHGYNTQNATGSPEKRVVRLNANYRIDCAFNIPLTLLKGSRPVVAATNAAQERAFAAMKASKASANSYFSAKQRADEVLKLVNADQLTASNSFAQQTNNGQLGASRFNTFSTDEEVIRNDLQISAEYLLVRTWLGGFRLSDFTYSQNGLVTLEATLYAEDIVDNIDDTSKGIGNEGGIPGDFPVSFGQSNSNVA